jgi:hypothetical protein
MATLEGTILAKNAPRTVNLRAPREGEPPTKTIHSVRILDTSLAETVDVESWSVDPWPTAIAGQPITVTNVKKLEHYAGKLRATV